MRNTFTFKRVLDRNYYRLIMMDMMRLKVIFFYHKSFILDSNYYCNTQTWNNDRVYMQSIGRNTCNAISICESDRLMTTT